MEPAGDEIPPPAALPEDIIHRSTSGVSHRLTPLVNEKTSQYARYIFEPVDSNMWSVVHEEGEMKVYRREMEEDGVVIDPLRANYTVNVRERERETEILCYCVVMAYSSSVFVRVSVCWYICVPVVVGKSIALQVSVLIYSSIL